MTRTELNELYEAMKKLEKYLKKHKAPMSVVRNLRDARFISVNWAIDNTPEDL